jgi:hypothetical protein
LEDIIRIVLREIGWSDIGWIHMAEDRGQWLFLVNTVMNLDVPKTLRNFGVAERLVGQSG